jgi:hypothetical protein
MRNIMCCVDSEEPVAEALECLQLERGLDTEHKCTLIQSRSRRWRVQLVLVKYRYIFGFKAFNP